MGLLDKYIKPSIVDGGSKSMERICIDDPAYRQTVEELVQFVGASKWKSRLTGFQIGFVSRSKKFMELVSRNGNQLDIIHRGTQLSPQSRMMETYYSMLIPKNRKLFRLQMSIRIKVMSEGDPISKIYDTQLQDICNLVTLAYLKREYPDMHILFNREIKVPSISSIEEAIQEQIHFDLTASSTYRLRGLELVLDSENEWDSNVTDQHKMLGDTLGFPKKVMIA